METDWDVRPSTVRRRVEKMKLSKYLYEALPEEFAQGYIEDATGWACHPNANFAIGPRYLSSCAAPTEINQIEYLLQFSRRAERGCIEWLYREVNGFRILSDRFTMPGVRDATIPKLGAFPSAAILDIRVFSGYGYPSFAPFDGFLVGKMTKSKEDGYQTLYDILTDTGSIISGLFNENSEILEIYSTFESWILSRVTSAAEDFRYSLSKL